MLQFNMNVLWTVINLLILFLLMKKFLYAPIQNIIAKRQELADQAMNEANAKQTEADAARVKYESSVKEVEDSKQSVISEARKTAGTEYQKILDQANVQAQTIMEEAKESAEREKFRMIRAAENDIADMVMNAAGRLAGLKGNNPQEQDLYDKFLNKAGETLDKG